MTVDADNNRLSALAHWIAVAGFVAVHLAVCGLSRWSIGRKNLRPFRILASIIVHHVAPKKPSSRTLLLAAYIALSALLMTVAAIKPDANHLERLGMRAGWLATAQIPLVVLLSMRASPLGLLLARDHLSLNFAHRWTGRVMMAVSTAHATFFVVEWLRAGFFTTALTTFRRIGWGFAAWGVLAWTAAASVRPVRGRAYEFFAAHHGLVAVVFLWFLAMHVHAASRVVTAISAAIVGLDVLLRVVNGVRRNVRFFSADRKRHDDLPRVGYTATATYVDDQMAALTIPGVRFGWTPGQHVYVWSPRLWWHSPHPFTVASLPAPDRQQDLRLVVRAKKGFTRATLDWTDGAVPVPVLLFGPFGRPPRWSGYRNFVLVSTSSGLAYTAPVLEHVAGMEAGEAGRRVSALVVVQRETHATKILEQLPVFRGRRSSSPGTVVDVEVAVTSTEGGDEEVAVDVPSVENDDRQTLLPQTLASPEPRTSHESESSTTPSRSSLSSTLYGRSRSSSLVSLTDLILDDNDDKAEMILDSMSGEKTTAAWSVNRTHGRPEVPLYIHNTVAACDGPTLVVVCGGRGLVRVVEETMTKMPREVMYDEDGCRRVSVHVESFTSN